MQSDDDTKLYAVVAKELSISRRDEGLWTMAFALENGDERATKARYIRERVAFLKRNRNGGGRRDESSASPAAADVAPEVNIQKKVAPPARQIGQVSPWARFFARTIDLGVVTALVFSAGVAMELSLPSWTLGAWTAALLGFLVFGIALLAYEAISVSEFGTTIGKAVFGLRIKPEQGGILDAKSAFRRAFWVWASGNGCYLLFPGASILFWWRGHRILKTTGSTPWDKRVETTVEQGGIGSFRFLLGASLSIVMLVGILTIAAFNKRAFKKEQRMFSYEEALGTSAPRRSLSDEEAFGTAVPRRSLSDEEAFGTAVPRRGQ
ncbi:MAG: RDD family protein [Candidatus Accumulibacter regalis]|uniref:RDD family protein n=1 Tax=Accumulibacter regalis TaxID=522306 RepID=A0A011QMD0_ACCRE|nr:RDD family protein [Accumulibacter sp.]EXI90200.1 MAG: RDD family protein [Candidatus Accumulibacter regalis]HRE72285.1 RDD family protein [Accumulibacter sp.]